MNNGGDVLARGGKSAQFPSMSHISDEKWNALWEEADKEAEKSKNKKKSKE